MKNLHNGKVVALKVPNACTMPRSEIDGYTEFVKIYGAKGLAYIKVNDRDGGREGLQSPIVKNLSDEILEKLLEVTGAKTGDIMTMPGLPKKPAAVNIDVDADGKITGLF